LREVELFRQVVDDLGAGVRLTIAQGFEEGNKDFILGRNRHEFSSPDGFNIRCLDFVVAADDRQTEMEGSCRDNGKSRPTEQKVGLSKVTAFKII
jgi:hypothetical protein